MTPEPDHTAPWVARALGQISGIRYEDLDDVGKCSMARRIVRAAEIDEPGFVKAWKDNNGVVRLYFVSAGREMEFFIPRPGMFRATTWQAFAAPLNHVICRRYEDKIRRLFGWLCPGRGWTEAEINLFLRTR